MASASPEIQVDDNVMADEEKGSLIHVKSRGGIRASNLILPGATDSIVLFNRALAEKIDSQADGEIGEDEIRSLLKKLLAEEKTSSRYKLVAAVALVLLGLVFGVTIASALVAVRLTERTTLSSSVLFEGNSQLVNKDNKQLVATEAVGGGRIVLSGLVTIPTLAPPGGRQLTAAYDDEDEERICNRERFDQLSLQAFIVGDIVDKAYRQTVRNGAPWSIKFNSENILLLENVSLPPGTEYNIPIDNSRVTLRDSSTEYKEFRDLFVKDTVLDRETRFAFICPRGKPRCCIYASRSVLEQEKDVEDFKAQEGAGNAEPDGRRILVGGETYRVAW